MPIMNAKPIKPQVIGSNIIFPLSIVICSKNASNPNLNYDQFYGECPILAMRLSAFIGSILNDIFLFCHSLQEYMKSGHDTFRQSLVSTLCRPAERQRTPKPAVNTKASLSRPLLTMPQTSP
jgi:hypothetical protein